MWTNESLVQYHEAVFVQYAELSSYHSQNFAGFRSCFDTLRWNLEVVSDYHSQVLLLRNWLQFDILIILDQVVSIVFVYYLYCGLYAWQHTSGGWTVTTTSLTIHINCSDRPVTSTSVTNLVQTLLSSANILISVLIQPGKSLTKTRNSSGPSSDPCRIPLQTWAQSEHSPLTMTLINPLWRKLAIHFSMLPQIPNNFSLVSSLSWGTVSKAFFTPGI